MASSITFVLKNPSDAERILDEFEERTGLASSTSEDDARVFPLEGEDHGIDVVQTLTDIDEQWTDHLAVRAPDADA